MEAEQSSAQMLGIIARPWTVKVAQSLGFTLTAFLAGQTASTTYAVLPAIMPNPPRLLLKELSTVRSVALDATQYGSMASLLVTMWLAAREPSIRTPTFKLYSTALALLASVGPYKSFVLKPLEGRMNERSLTSSSEELEREISYDSTSLREFIQSLWSRQEADEKQMNMHQLADRWGWLNLGMAGMIMASAVCSAYGMAQEELSFFELF